MEASKYFEVCKPPWENWAVNYSYKLLRSFVKTAAHNWRNFNNYFTFKGTFWKAQIEGIFLNLYLTINENLSFNSSFVPLRRLSPHLPKKDKTTLRSHCPISAIIPNADNGTKGNVHRQGWYPDHWIMALVCQISTMERLQQGTD